MKLSRIFQRNPLTSHEKKAMLRALVARDWPDLPPWSNLEKPIIEEVQKASIGSGVCIIYQKDGIWKVLLGQAGAHYHKNKPDQAPAYTIPGGFVNLTHTEGSSKVKSQQGKPENIRETAAREVEEEFKQPDGSPLLTIEPSRLDLCDSQTIIISSPHGEEVRVVIGLMLELEPNEIKTVEQHLLQMKHNVFYRNVTAKQTINPASNAPEIEDVIAFDLEDVAKGHINLLHKDQQSLFQIVWNKLKQQQTSKRMVAKPLSTTPTPKI